MSAALAPTSRPHRCPCSNVHAERLRALLAPVRKLAYSGPRSIQWGEAEDLELRDCRVLSGCQQLEELALTCSSSEVGDQAPELLAVLAQGSPRLRMLEAENWTLPMGALLGLTALRQAKMQMLVVASADLQLAAAAQAEGACLLERLDTAALNLEGLADEEVLGCLGRLAPRLCGYSGRRSWYGGDEESCSFKQVRASSRDLAHPLQAGAWLLGWLLVPCHAARSGKVLDAGCPAGCPTCAPAAPLQVLQALRGHPGLATLHALELSGCSQGPEGSWTPEWRELLQLVLSSPRLREASLSLGGGQRPTVCGRGMQLVASAPCAGTLETLSFCHVHDCWWTSYGGIGLADAALLLGPGCGLQLKQLGVVLDVWQDVADLEDGLERLRRQRGRKQQRQQPPGAVREQPWRSGKPQAQRLPPLPVQDAALLERQVLAHAARMLAAGPLLQAAKVCLEEEQQRALEHQSREQGLPKGQLAQAPCGASRGADSDAFRPVQREGRLAVTLARWLGELPGASEALPAGWREALKEGVLLRRRLKLMEAHLKEPTNYSDYWNQVGRGTCWRIRARPARCCICVWLP
jgi:hypothetical protein